MDCATIVVLVTMSPSPSNVLQMESSVQRTARQTASE
jgi:hypothetical protein